MSTYERCFKRPFQPSINSYYGRASVSARAHNTLSTSILNPILPGLIQSSLLNVGMRIRKSVPEGYKTRSKTFCGATTNSWGTLCPLADSQIQNIRSIPSTELAPYCGIMKVGGHQDLQPVPVEENIPLLQFDHESWELALPSSQDCFSSDDHSANILIPGTAAGGTTKRRREDADEEDLDTEARPMSPRTRPVSHTPMPNLNSLRPIAIPKTRRQMVHSERVMESEMFDVADFEEADFLRPLE